MPEVTQQLLREVYEYNPETGVFTHKLRRRGTRVGSIAGAKMKDGYIKLAVLQRQTMAHRMAWLYMTGSMPSGQIDHINGIRDDNRFCNLRDVTQSVNMQNRRSASKGKKSCGLLGVRREPGTQKWGACISKKMPDGSRAIKTVYGFDTPELAHAAYIDMKREIHEGCTL